MTDETVERLIQAHNRRVRRMLRAVIVAYVAAFVLSGTAVFVATYASSAASSRATEAAIRDSERKWCSLLVPLDDNYRITSPPTESGQRFASIIHNLRVDFGC